MTGNEEKDIIDRLQEEASEGYPSGAPMNALRRAAGLPELESPDRKLQIEAPKIERELKKIRKELHRMNDILSIKEGW